MKLTTLDSVAGRIVEDVLGVVRGTALWARRITKSSMGGIRNLHATGCRELDEGLNAAKEQVSAEIVAQATRLGADAIVGLRLEVAELSNGTFCVNATGTAVKTVKLPQALPAFTAAPTGGDAALAFLAARPSFEGSSLRH